MRGKYIRGVCIKRKLMICIKYKRNWQTHYNPNIGVIVIMNILYCKYYYSHYLPNPLFP